MIDDSKPAPTSTWEESVETRLAFVESVIRAGHAVGQEPGTAPTPPAVITDSLGSAKDYWKNPPPAPPTPPSYPKQPKFQKAEK